LAVAVNCSVWPGLIEGVSGLKDIEVTLTLGIWAGDSDAANTMGNRASQREDTGVLQRLWLYL